MPVMGGRQQCIAFDTDTVTQTVIETITDTITDTAAVTEAITGIFTDASYHRHCRCH